MSECQDSCACTRLLCMHNILVHAGPRPKGPAQLCFWVPGLVPGPWLGPWPLGSLAQCMHQNVVHAQECCACTRILCMHKNLDILTTRPAKALQRPGKGLAKALQRLAKALQRYCKGLQRPAKAMQRPYKGLAIVGLRRHAKVI